jgi:hypothetical protein
MNCYVAAAQYSKIIILILFDHEISYKPVNVLLKMASSSSVSTYEL